jgi:CBS domain-containing protein
MKVKDIMTRDVDILPPDATLKNAAERMERLDVGFLPIADAANRKLQGVITDRDLAIRGLAHGLGPDALAQDIESKRVLYCFEDQEVEEAARQAVVAMGAGQPEIRLTTEKHMLPDAVDENGLFTAVQAQAIFDCIFDGDGLHTIPAASLRES